MLRITDGSTEFSGVIKDGGNFGGIEIRSGTLTLSGASTFTGPAELRGGGTLALKGAGSMVNAGVDFIGGPGTATFDISQTTSGASILGLIDTGFDGGVVALGSKELKITVGSPFFSGVIQDGGIGGGTGGSLRIASLAIQILTGVNTYTGATTDRRQCRPDSRRQWQHRHVEQPQSHRRYRDLRHRVQLPYIGGSPESGAVLRTRRLSWAMPI